MKMKKCPKCGSANVRIYNYMGAECIACRHCGYDESSDLDIPPESRSSQREKGRYSPYKAGGSQRASKAR